MGFLAWLLPLLAKLGLDFWTHRGPAPVVVEAEKAGGAVAEVAQAEQAVRTETAVADAEATAPHTLGDEETALKDGRF